MLCYDLELPLDFVPRPQVRVNSQLPQAGICGPLVGSARQPVSAGHLRQVG